MARVNISFTTENTQIKQVLDDAADSRGETSSEAMDKILHLGLPLYLEKYPEKPKAGDLKARVEAAIIGMPKSPVSDTEQLAVTK